MSEKSQQGSSKSSSGRFNLQWKQYAHHLSSGIRDLGFQEKLTDVTLACEGQTRRAHKLLLSLTSPYFKKLFETYQNEPGNTIVIVNHVRFKDLENILIFIYTGQVNVGQEDLNPFLQAAELLQIDGLTSPSDVPEACERDPIETVPSRINTRKPSHSSSPSSEHNDGVHQQQSNNSNRSATTTTNPLAHSSLSGQNKGINKSTKLVKTTSSVSPSHRTFENSSHSKSGPSSTSQQSDDVKAESSSGSPIPQIHIRPLTEVIDLEDEDDDNNITSFNNQSKVSNDRLNSNQNFVAGEVETDEKEVDFAILDLKAEGIQIFEMDNSDKVDEQQAGMYDSLGNEMISPETTIEEQSAAYYMEASSAPSTSQHFDPGVSTRSRLSPQRLASSSSSSSRRPSNSKESEGKRSRRGEQMKVEDLLMHNNNEDIMEDEAQFLSSLELPTVDNFYSTSFRGSSMIMKSGQQQQQQQQQREKNRIQSSHPASTQIRVNHGGVGGGFGSNQAATRTARLIRGLHLTGNNNHHHHQSSQQQAYGNMINSLNNVSQLLSSTTVVCPLCSKTFKNKNSLKVHRSLYHRINRDSYSSPRQLRRQINMGLLRHNYNNNNNPGSNNNNNAATASPTNNASSSVGSNDACFLQSSQHF